MKSFVITGDILDTHRLNSSSDEWLTSYPWLEQSKTSYKHVFSHLINSMAQHEFFDKYWEKKALLFARSSEKSITPAMKSMLKIFSKKQLLDICHEHPIPDERNQIRRVTHQDGHGIEYKAQTNDTFINKKDLKESMEDFTIQFPQPQRFSDELYAINAGFEHVFGTLAGCSSYLTPPYSQGLSPHYDDIEAFILQTEGTKLWRLWNGPIVLPDQPSGDLHHCDLPSNPVEVILYPGDMLYLPRGTIHEAVAQDSFSTHVTISVYQKYHLASLLPHVISSAIERCKPSDIDLRTGLPINFYSSFGTYAHNIINFGSISLSTSASHSSNHESNSTISQVTVREKLYVDVKNKLLELAANLQPYDLDVAADEIIADFSAHRLPPPDLAAQFDDYVGVLAAPEDGSNKKRKALSLSEVESIRICDPRSFFCRVDENEHGLTTLSLIHSRFLSREHHMGHPSIRPTTHEEEDEEDEEEGEVEDEDELAPVTCELPVRLSPLVQLLRESYHTGCIHMDELIDRLKPSRLNADDVTDAVGEMDRHGFIEAITLQTSADSTKSEPGAKKKKTKLR